MANVAVMNMNGEQVGSIELNDAIFGIEANEHVMHLAVVQYLANQRQGTQSTKTRAEVSGGGRKPWRQKGTGHARQGSIRAVQWRGGGVALGPVPRDYSKKQNRKERRLALKTALTNLANEGNIIVLDSLTLATPKTKDFIKVLENLKIADKKDLIVTKQLDENLILASRNVQNVMLQEANEINVLDLVTADYLVITEDALKQIEEVLK